ncbi:MAG: glycoside hydrolase, partial [Thermoplasmata archaeon]|nr:glycoside hydrolase [Thermoplasmata archaeon]
MRGNSQPTGRTTPNVPPAVPSPRWGRELAIFIGFLMLVSSLGLVGTLRTVPSTAPPAPTLPGVHLAATPSEQPKPHGGLPVTGSFYASDPNAGTLSAADTFCSLWFVGYNMCYPQSQNPSVLTLANGEIGLAFSAVTSATASTCPNATGNTTSRIAFTTSSNGGLSFSSPQLISNIGGANCPYYQGIEPSFTTGTQGEIFGAYVIANATLAEMGFPTLPFGRPVVPYVSRNFDALAFTSSTDNGTSFSTPTVLVTSNISDPQIAAYGSTVYIVYENVSNGTTNLIGDGSPPVSLNFLYSTDAGVSWNGPAVVPGYLPGSDILEANNSIDPSIAVSPTGEVAIAFAANRSCYQYCSAFFQTYASDVVVVTSTTNGTTWSGPYIVAQDAAELSSDFGNVGAGTFENLPTTSIKFGGSSSDLYVAWAQAENLSLSDQYAFEYNWQSSGVKSAASTDGGLLWTVANASPALDRGDPIVGGVINEGYYNPALGYSNGTVYLEFGFYSYTEGAAGYETLASNIFGAGDSQWAETSVDGVNWSGASLLEYFPDALGLNDYAYYGSWGSIGFTASGSPVLAWSLPSGWFDYNPAIGYTQPVALGVSVLSPGATTNLTIDESGLTAGTSWSAWVNGNIFATTQSSITVANVPVGASLYLAWPGPITYTGYRTAVEPLLSVGPLINLSGPTVAYFNFTDFYGISFTPEPGNVPFLEIEYENYGNQNPYSFNFYWETYLTGTGSAYYYTGGDPFPWYIPEGTQINLSSTCTYPEYKCYDTYDFVGYWNGTGAGSYTGSGSSADLTVLSPFNETVWMAAASVYSERVAAPGLGASSTFHFDLDGTPYSGTGGGWVNVPGLATGAHWISNIDATSTDAGWEYFGFAPQGNPVIVPNVPVVNLTFADVDLSAAPRTLSFQAEGLPTGSEWHLSVNGTEYSSSTDWINITAHPGLYPYAAFPVISANGTSAFTPITSSGMANLSTASSFEVDFTTGQQVQVIASLGGSVSGGPGTSWLGTGAFENLTATPEAGFSFGGWSGSGSGSYSGPNTTAEIQALGPIVESANFIPHSLTQNSAFVNETGLPNGTLWSADLGGQGYATNTTQLEVSNLYSCAISGGLGIYPLAVPYAYPNGSTSGTRYVPTAYPATVCGGGAPATVQFSTQYSIQTTSTTGGSATASYTGNEGSALWIGAGDLVSLSATPNPGYLFVGWQGTGASSYSGPEAAPTVQLSGPVTELAVFSPLTVPPTQTYVAAIHETTPLATGTSWAVTLGGSTYASITAWINVSGLAPNDYKVTALPTLSPDGLIQYTPTPAGFSIDVKSGANPPVSSVAFATQYWVQIIATGPGAISPNSGWSDAGSLLT